MLLYQQKTYQPHEVIAKIILLKPPYKSPAPVTKKVWLV